MRKKGQVNIMLMLLVGLIIGTVSLSIIFSLIGDQTATTAITADQFTASNATCVSTTTNCIVAGSGVLINSTNTTDIATGNFTECDSNADSKLDGFSLDSPGGEVRWDTTTINASYNERSCAFIEGGITTLVVNNIPVLFAVALLVFVAAAIALR